jgi:alkanesulfonate monooxygenase SsuD/methylene tetrahydromethanopterin reductase-like flavin-dependent oxidoreductase (luciferase family)
MGTADECVDEIVGFVRKYGVTDIASSGLPPGIDPSFMEASLNRLATQVLPRVRAQLEA